MGTANGNSSVSYSPSSVSDEGAVANTRNVTSPEEENPRSQDADAFESSDSDFSSSHPVHDKIMHYLKGSTVSHKNREAVENAIVAAAGLHTMEYKRGTTDQRNTIMLNGTRRS